MNAELVQDQQALLAALWAPRMVDAIELIAVRAGGAGTNGQKHLKRGLDAYRANAQALAPRALVGAYPVLARLLGDDNFSGLARLHWRSHPPQRGDLAEWGGELPAHIRQLPDLAEAEPYLADLAEVEWALHRCATAADGAPDWPSLALLTSEDPDSLTLQLAPGTACITSEYPVVSLMLAYQTDQSPDQASQSLNDGAAETAVIWRQGLQPLVRLAWPGEHGLLAALLSGQSFGQSLAVAQGLDLQAWLPFAVQGGLVLGARRCG